TSDTYLPNYYGEMAGINSGLSSDRLMADWDLSAPVAAALAAGEARPPQTSVPLAIALPETLETLTRDAPDRARSLRPAPREELQSAFAQGRRIVDFDRARRLYLLTP